MAVNSQPSGARSSHMFVAVPGASVQMLPSKDGRLAHDMVGLGGSGIRHGGNVKNRRGGSAIKTSRPDGWWVRHGGSVIRHGGWVWFRRGGKAESGSRPDGNGDRSGGDADKWKTVMTNVGIILTVVAYEINDGRRRERHGVCFEARKTKLNVSIWNY